MTQRPFRFLHASDFHLERPAGGLAEVPDQLRELFLECPYLAAERVFETALAEQVEFVVLSGDILDAELCSPRGPLFLTQQFKRLQARGIAVYWAGGQVDSLDTWSEAWPFPDNVRLFATARAEDVRHLRQGEPLARVSGLSRTRGRKIRTSEFSRDPGGLFTVAVAHGATDAETLAQRDVDYWALGGSHGRQTLLETPRLALYAGSPQGREPRETGPHGCTVVQVDSEGHARARFVATDVLRWQRERVPLTAGMTRNELERVLQDRVRALGDSSPGIDVLAQWTVFGAGPLMTSLRRGSLAKSLLEGLRGPRERGAPAVWSWALETEPAETVNAGWNEEQTLLGDYMRAIRKLQSPKADKPGKPALDLAAYLGEPHRAGPIAELTRLDEPKARQRVLRKAAALGLDLLSGEEPTL